MTSPYELLKIIVLKKIENQNSENEFCNKRKLNTTHSVKKVKLQLEFDGFIREEANVLL